LRETEAVQHQVTALLKCDVGFIPGEKKLLAELDRSWTMNPRTRLRLRSSECL
jgi:hypothetical protein